MDSSNFKNLDQIIKINGVSPSALAKLHEVLDGPKVRSRYQRDLGKTDIVYARLLNVKWNSEYGTYTVEIQLPLKLELNFVYGLYDTLHHRIVEDNKKVVLSPPYSVLRAIYDALGFYPNTEELV